MHEKQLFYISVGSVYFVYKLSDDVGEVLNNNVFVPSMLGKTGTLSCSWAEVVPINIARTPIDTVFIFLIYLKN